MTSGTYTMSSKGKLEPATFLTSQLQVIISSALPLQQQRTPRPRKPQCDLTSSDHCGPVSLGYFQ